jgi:hypothetical protein
MNCTNGEMALLDLPSGFFSFQSHYSRMFNIFEDALLLLFVQSEKYHNLLASVWELKKQVLKLTPYSKKTTSATSSSGREAGAGGPSDAGVSSPRTAGADAGVCRTSSEAGVSGTDDGEKGSRGLRVKTGDSELMYPSRCALGEYAVGKYVPWYPSSSASDKRESIDCRVVDLAGTEDRMFEPGPYPGNRGR